MVRRIRFLSFTLAVALLAGCSSSSPNNTLPTAVLGITVSPATVVANGTNTVSVTVTGSTNGGAVTASANRGLFSNGQKAVQAASTPTTLTLVTCNGEVDAGCAGTVVIRAVDGLGVAGVATVTFTSSGGGVVCSSCGAAACVGVVCDADGHTCSSESPSTCSACPTGLVEICNDGVDNNCNGLVDCTDPQCQPVGNDPGAFCNLVGHTCSVNGAPGPSACTTCSGNGGTVETAEVSCGDGKDNDCNGLVDCQDANCAGSPCAFGFTCDSVKKTCSVPSATCTTCGQPACVGMTCDVLGHTCGAESPSTCNACPGGSVEICNDGKDNNCNGLIDCAEASCQPVGNEPGALCDAVGHTCSVKGTTGTSTCAVCSGNGGTPEAREASCGDGKDNDCNGLVDCQDPNCSSLPCALGFTCDPTAKTCSVPSSSCATCGQAACIGLTCDALGHACSSGSPSTCSTCPAGAVEICNDGKDNNCDGLVDCADPQCQPVGNALGAVCNAVGLTCSTKGATGSSTCSVCSGNGGTPEATEVSCGDGKDNNCNGLIDCQDASCSGQPCAFGFTCDATAKTCTVASTACTSCGQPACIGMTCDALGHACSSGSPSTCSTCPAGAVEICNDGKDNNCDGLVDCADPQCQPVGNALGAVCNAVGLTCSTKGATGSSTCSVCSGNGGTPEATEVSCGDGKDNNCNGLIDCQDASCSGQPCAFGFTCDATAKTCSVPSTTCTTCGQPACVGMTCDAAGRVCSSGAPSTCTTCPAGVTTCADPVLFTLTLVPASERIPANGTSTTIITGTLTFDGAPVAGKTIAFSSTSAGTVISTAGPTDSSGRTTVVLQSTAAGGVATVTGSFAASTTSTVTGTTTVTMPALGRVTFLSAQYEVLGAFSSGFQERSVLTYQLFDSTNLPYPPGLEVTFTHESLGSSFIGPSFAGCTGTPATCTATGVTDALGRTTVEISSGTVAGEVAVNADAVAGEVPRSAGAHKLAIVGAKANGAHITMDCFVSDSAETHTTVRNMPAFATSDCSFSQYVEPTGKLVFCRALLADRFNNVIGRESRVQFFSEAGTAGPSALTPPYDTTATPGSQQGLGIASSYVRPDGKLPADVAPFAGELFATYADGCSNGTHNPRDGLVTVISIASGDEGFVDLNGNGVWDAPHCNGTTDVCSSDATCGGVAGSCLAGEPFVDMGEPYIDANDNGTWDVGEFFVDVDGNGTWTPPDGTWTDNTVIWVETRVLFSGLPLNRVSGGTSSFQFGGFFNPVTFDRAVSFSVASGTSQSGVFAIGDGNYNPPPGGASFAASMTGANATAVVSNPASTDGLSMAFTQQYCTVRTLEEVSGGAVCANVCPGGRTSNPCYVVTNVGNCTPGSSPRSGCSAFGFGSIGQVQITGGTPPGPNTLQVTGISNTTPSETASGSLPGTVTP